MLYRSTRQSKCVCHMKTMCIQNVLAEVRVPRKQNYIFKCTAVPNKVSE